MVALFCIIIALILIILFLPVKTAINIKTISNGGTQYYICQQVSTTGPNWCIVGDRIGFYDEKETKLAIIEGVNPAAILNKSVQIDSPNTYIIYGEITSEYYDKTLNETFPVITSKGFDMAYPIIRGYSFRVFVPKDYLTLLDYKWFSN